MNRENTNFSLELARKLAITKWSPQYNCLYYHQNIARTYFNEASVRGLLIYHGTGMGKSILAASIIFDAMFPTADNEKPRKIIILLAKSLAHNMVEAMDDYLDLRAAVDPDLREHNTLGAIIMLPHDERRKWLRAQFKTRARFVTMNASNMMDQMARVSNSMIEHDEDLVIDTKADALLARVTRLDNCLLIVDEAHGLFRAIINGSRNAVELYQRVMGATNMKIAFLTGTPIASDPFEMAVCFNMLTGKQIFPVQYTEFTQLFVAQDQCSMRNRHVFQNRIMGLISYVTSDTQIGSGVREIVSAIHTNELAVSSALETTAPRDRDVVRVDFPKELPLEVVRIKMDPEQYGAYISAREQEKAEGLRKAEAMTGGAAASDRRTNGNDKDNTKSRRRKSGGKPKVLMPMRSWRAPETPALQKPKSEFSSTYRVYSRQISNYCPPAAIRRMLYEVKQEGGEMSINDILKQIGDIESVKFRAILSRIQTNHMNQLGLIYSQFVGIGGLAALARFLDQNGFKGKYNLISGEVDPEERARIITRFCDKSNAHAEHIALLLISATGAEGIDLKNVRHVHILEPYWNYGRIQQVKARAIRNGSHVDLPPDERNVSTYLYIAIDPSPGKIDTGDDDSDSDSDSDATELVNERTSDEELYESSRTGHLLISAFEIAMREVSIECALNHTATDSAKMCRLCAPTSAPLFTESILQDTHSVDPCRAIVSQKISAKKIRIGDIDYYYRKATPDSVEARAYGYELFVHDATLHGWRKLALNDENYSTIVEQIVIRASEANDSSL